MEVIDQQVINDNKEIYAKIQSELLAAEFQILIATGWFTDEDLFNLLLGKIQEGIHVEIVIADNQENEKLDFGLLTAKGAAVYKIKNSGYGMMNQKFCVIDKRIALHGSYNWSVNAKKNNQESIIRTNHQETIASLIENFETIKQRITEQKPLPQPEKPKGIILEPVVRTTADFEALLDSMIAAEVGSFDRKLLREQGFERCKANTGDHQVLFKAFDSVYSVFINDIDVIDDKKKRLIAKIEEHKIRTLDLLMKNCELAGEHLEKEQELEKRRLEIKMTGLDAEIAITERSIESIRTEKIPGNTQKAEEITQQIQAAEREFITPGIKWFELIPTVLFGVALLIYLFIFYSSAAYILLFSVADAREAQLGGTLSGAAAQVFNPAAFGKALHKGGTAPLFIFLFVTIPLAAAVIDLFTRVKWVQLTGFICCVIGLDGAVAYKVTEAVHQVNLLSGNTMTPWHWSAAFQDTNFYLVFLFGGFGLLLFKFAFKKFYRAFEDRDPDIVKQRAKLQIRQLRAEIELLQQKIALYLDEAGTFEKQIIQYKAENKNCVQDVAGLLITLNRELKHIQDQLSVDSDTIEKTATVYTLHIQSDNLPISVDALKDRINVFLEGWNDYLFQEYAIGRATTKTREALDTAMLWQNEKLQANKIDKRVKFTTCA